MLKAKNFRFVPGQLAETPAGLENLDSFECMHILSQTENGRTAMAAHLLPVMKNILKAAGVRCSYRDLVDIPSIWTDNQIENINLQELCA